MKIILGSSSKPRRKVMEDHNYIFEIMSPDIDEKAIRSENYYELPLLLARAKAEALLSRIKKTQEIQKDGAGHAGQTDDEPAIIITADQVTVCEGDLHEKPEDEKEAREFLNKYSAGKKPETVSALVVTNTQTGKKAEGVDIVKLHFENLPEEVINNFIKNEDPFSKSGGFSVESTCLRPYISKIEGDVDSVMGLPMKLLRRLMEEVG